MLREFSFGSGHISKEQSANILQTLLNKRFNLLEPRIKPPAVSREKFFADIVEFPLALPQLIEQRGRPMSFRDGGRQVGYLGCSPQRVQSSPWGRPPLGCSASNTSRTCSSLSVSIGARSSAASAALR